MNLTQGGLFKQQSVRSLQKYKTEHIEERVNQRSRQLMGSHGRHVTQPVRNSSNGPRSSLPAPNDVVKNHNMPFMVTRNPVNTHHTSLNSNQDELTRKVRALETELKRKLMEDSLLRNIFRTKKSHQYSHIDLYLQLREMETQLESARAQAKQLENEKEEHQNQHLEMVQEMSVKVSQKEEEWGNQKAKLKNIVEDLQDKQQTISYLLDEMKRKNGQLIRKNEKLTEEMEIEREARVLERVKEQAEKNAEQDIEKQRVEELMERIGALESQCEELRESNRQLRCQEEASQEQLEEMQSMVEDVKQKLSEAEAERDGLAQERKNQLEVHRKMRISQEEELQTQASQFQTQIQQLRAEVDDKSQTLDNLLKSSSELSIALEAAKKELKAKDTEIERLSTALEGEREAGGSLAREAKQYSYLVEQKQAELKQALEELSERNELVDRLEEKLHECNQSKEQLQHKVHSLTQQADYIQSFSKLNDRIYNQNYKCLGLLIGVNSQLRKHLSQRDQKVQPQEPNELEPVVSQLNQLVEQLLAELSALRGRGRECNSWLREVRQLLEQMRNLVSYPATLSLMDSYSEVLKERQNGHDSVESAGVFHQLIETIRHHRKEEQLFIREEPLQDNYFSVPDSLEGTTLLPRTDSLHKLKQSRQKSKHRMQMEQQACRQRLFEEEDKENRGVNSKNRVHTQGDSRCDSHHNYLREVRHRIARAPLQSHKEEDRRSQVERKYFRS